MDTFAQATTVEKVEDTRFRAIIPDGWQQGRGAYGGLVLATLLRAMEGCEPEPGRRVRALTGELCGPALPGESDVQVSVLRRGGRVTNLDARLVQAGEVVARASALVSPARDIAVPPPPREVPLPRPWQDSMVAPVQPPLGPAFARFFEFRPTGPLPFSGGAEPVASGWIRLKTPPARLDSPTLIGYLDAWWPAFFSVVAEPCHSATVTFMAELLVDPGTLRADEPLYHTGRVVGAGEWFFVEYRELWSGSTLVAMNQQTFALLR